MFSPVVANSFDGASREGFFTELTLFFRFGLLVNERIRSRQSA